MKEGLNIERERICFKALSAVLRDGAYSAQALNDALKSSSGEDEYITRLFYGVLEKNITLEYIINALVEKRPKQAVYVVLKMGTYMARYMNTPIYAVVDRCVELSKSLGKEGACGFINAVLRKVAEVKLPDIGKCKEREYLSVVYGLPIWLAQKFVSEYGFEFVENMMRADEFRTHIRLKKTVNVNGFEKSIEKFSASEIEKTKFGYYVTHNTIKQLVADGILAKNDYAVQSLASAIAVNCYAQGLNEASSILDLCAAPGGKAVYIAELVGGDVTACDIHEHRVGLIKSYACRMGVKINAVLNDACVKREDWVSAFDCVVCDVPCSGTGDLRSRPDILLWRTPDGVKELSALQSRILRTASLYVGDGGKLCYSTCSLLKEENESIIENFLRHNRDFKLENCSDIVFGGDLQSGKLNERRLNGGNSGESCDSIEELVCKNTLKLFPHIDRTDGFFVAVMRKNGGAK
ncbi:MAG: hypothetical protein HFK09_00930 [Clostridia bacterium]|nr:hypothetical protein [Clostridia bacterium]